VRELYAHREFGLVIPGDRLLATQDEARLRAVDIVEVRSEDLVHADARRAGTEPRCKAAPERMLPVCPG